MPRPRGLLLASIVFLAIVQGPASAQSEEASAGIRWVSRENGFRVESARMAIECSRDLQLQVFLKNDRQWMALSPDQALPRVISVGMGKSRVAEFSLAGTSTKQSGIHSRFGDADVVSLEAVDTHHTLKLALAMTFPQRFPDAVVLEATFMNLGKSQPVAITEVAQAALQFEPGTAPKDKGEILFWSLQGGGYRWGADYVLPVRTGFAQDNFTGPKGKANGGGFPFVDLWRREMGVAVALLDPKPALAWVPVTVSDRGVAQVQVVTRPSLTLPPGKTYSSAPVMMVVHRGDFYDPVVRYRELMGGLGFHVVDQYDPDDYAPAWCTWGFRRNFTVADVLAKIPQMQAMGMRDLILDDGWFDRFGDWQPTPKKFPGGEADMKALIDKVHAAGLKFRLWWSPGSADPGSEIDRRHPDWFVLDKTGQREKASWNAYYLCPAYAPVREWGRALVKRFVADWSVDSFKLDGTSLNHAPLCFNRKHGHARPGESFAQWPALFREIRETARALRPEFRIEFCPCGITPTVQMADSFEQPTDSDPFDYQVTARVKFLKALLGPRSPVLQEYVGLFENQQPYEKEHPFRVDLYARAVGTGQVPSTFSTVLAKTHAKWSEIYNRHRPAEGEYLNFYDIRWETPEGHVIRKGSNFYYGFFTQEPAAHFSGDIQLRGLEAKKYRVTDYETGRVVGEMAGPTAELRVSFEDSLLLAAEPIAP